MRSSEHINVFIKRGDELEDITDGLISFDNLSLFDYDQGIWASPDSGQFTLVTRNLQADPYLNDLIRFNSQIQVSSTETGIIFNGYITEINVEYQPGGEPAIVTISGVDLLGLLQKVYITKEQEDYFKTEYGQRVDLATFLSETVDLDYFTELGAEYTITSASDLGAGGLYSYILKAKIAPKAGESVWDLITKYTTTDLMSFDIAYGEFLSQLIMGVYPKYDSKLMFLNSLPEFDPNFSSDPADNKCSYRSIVLNDGFDRTINQVEVQNTARYYAYPSLDFIEDNETFGPYSDIQSMTDWGVSKFEISTIMSAPGGIEAEVDDYAAEIIRSASTPEISIKEITFDGNRYLPIEGITWDREDILYSTKTTDIKHEVVPGNFIQKTYRIIGERHSIDANDWIITYILAKPYAEIAIQNQGPEPVLTMNTTTGDTSFSFIGTVSGYPTEEIEEIYWCINTPVGVGPDYYYAKDPDIAGATPFTGTTFTWTYDDDGVLAPWVAAGSPWYGPGAYEISAFILNTNGWVIGTAPTTIYVEAAEVEANFSYTVSSQGFYTFTDLSTPDAEEWTWDFGDGTTYEGKTPPAKYYTANDTYDVSLTVSNGITTDTHTVPITVNMTKIPVRYVKFEWDTVSVNNTSPRVASPFRSISVNRSSGPGGSIAANNTVTKQEITGTFKRSGSGLPTWNPATEGNYVWDSPTLTTEVYPTAAISGSDYTYDMSFTNTLRQLVGTDPGTGEGIFQDYFTDISDIFFYTTQNPSTTTAPVKVYVSSDNVTFYEVGYFEVTNNPSIPFGTVRGFSLTKTVPWPPNFPL
jgi:PKD repeat protein